MPTKGAGSDLFADTDTPPYPEYLAKLAPKLIQRYEFDRVHNAGHSGQTYLLRNRIDDSLYCLKTVKPGFSDPTRVRETLSKEVSILKPLSHRCLPRIYENDFRSEPPYYICTYHPGKTFPEFRDSGRMLELSEATTVVTSMIDTLEYLHSQGRTHCDLHQENILISDRVLAEGIMIIDLGSGHDVKAGKSHTRERGQLALKLLEDIPRFREDVERHLMGDSWRATDFKALGTLLLLMRRPFFGKANSQQRAELTAFGKALLAEQILDWSSIRQRFEYVLDPDLLVTRTERFLTRSDAKRPTIQLPATGAVRVGDAALAIINCRSFQRLRGIKQLSFCEWYFPGAVHTRFEHSLGVFGGAQSALRHLSRQDEVKIRFSQRNIDGALLAALVHDVGHYPLAHVIEHYVAARYASDTELREVIHHYNHSINLLDHDSELRSAIEKHWGEDVRLESLKNLAGHSGILSQIIDGPIDCDKLDYLRRDAHHCGVSYGRSLDADEILSSYMCSPVDGNLVIPEDRVQAIEGMILAQDQMLATVYWARTTRALFAMCHRFLDIVLGAEEEKNGHPYLKQLVTRLKQCANEPDAFRVLNDCISWAEKKYRKAAEDLISLHSGFNFSALYVPIQKYSYTDQVKAHYGYENPYQRIVPSSRFTMESKVLAGSGSTVPPIRWDLVRRLRQSYIKALRDRGVEGVTSTHVLIDVPWGKPTNSMISVYRSDGTIVPITKVSHISGTYFALPIAHIAPIRIYVHPSIHAKITRSIDVITLSAEKTFEENSALDEE